MKKFPQMRKWLSSLLLATFLMNATGIGFVADAYAKKGGNGNDKKIAKSTGKTDKAQKATAKMDPKIMGEMGNQLMEIQQEKKSRSVIKEKRHCTYHQAH